MAFKAQPQFRFQKRRSTCLALFKKSSRTDSKRNAFFASSLAKCSISRTCHCPQLAQVIAQIENQHHHFVLDFWQSSHVLSDELGQLINHLQLDSFLLLNIIFEFFLLFLLFLFSIIRPLSCCRRNSDLHFLWCVVSSMSMSPFLLSFHLLVMQVINLCSLPIGQSSSPPDSFPDVPDASL